VRAGFTKQIGWDGAPKWATYTDGLPTCRANGVREVAPAVAEAWQSFYADRDGIQTRLVDTWRKLAHEFASEPAIAGFDIINEPHPGFAPSASAASELAMFYSRAIAAIRSGEQGGFAHIVFFEPLVVWSASAVDAVPPPTFTGDPDIVFAPHLYAGSISADRTAGTPFLTPRDGHEFASEAAATYDTTYWSGEWGWFGDPAGDRDAIAQYASEEDARRVGGAWWDWKQACGDPHQINDANGGGVSPSLNRYACPEQRALGIPDSTRRILARAYPRAAPGLLTMLVSDPGTGALRISGTNPDPGAGCELSVWLPGDRGRPRLAGTHVTRLALTPFAGGWRASGCATGSYELHTTSLAGRPPAHGPRPGARRCLVRHGSAKRTGIGLVRLRTTRAGLVRRTGVRPVRRSAFAYGWCVRGFAGRIVAVFGARSRRARAELVVSTVRGLRTRGVGRGSSRRLLLRRFPAARLVRRNLYLAGPHGHRLFGVRARRVRFVAVARAALLARPAALARELRRSGLAA
jgi:hypothetical protein